MTIEWAKPTRNNNSGHHRAGGVSISLCKAQEGRPEQLSFGIQQDVMKAMRWVIGDRVMFGRDSETGVFVLARHPDGYKLTPRSTGKGKDVVGQCVAATLRITLPLFFDKSLLPLTVNLKDCECDGSHFRFSHS
jgi:hypothetical protein